VTLILAAITRGYAIVSSDRRITVTVNDPSEPTGFRVEQQEDSDTKTTLFDRRYVMGFAGVGRIRYDVNEAVFRERIESWKMQNLTDVGDADMLELLANKFGQLYEQKNYLKRHCFLAAGYRTDGRRGATDPEIVTVQNSQRFPQTFDVERESLGDRDFLFRHTGFPLTPDQVRAAEKAIERSVKRRPHQPFDMVSTFVELSRAAAPASGGTGGTSILVTTLPRKAVLLLEVINFHLERHPLPSVYLDREVTDFYPDSDADDGSTSYQPTFISREFTAGGAISVIGGKEPGPLEGDGSARHRCVASASAVVTAGVRHCP
jgi:hypothetical protein